MFAILEIGGKQYIAREGDVLRVEKIETEGKETVLVNKVLLLADKETDVGTPYLSGKSVELKVLSTGLGDKTVQFKMKSKKRYKRLKGHRQPYSDVKVLKIKA
ncbi:MAG: 50S ribosomal protein L21 [Patescibacteria group bacterium]